MTEQHTADLFRRWGYLQADLDDFGRLPPASHAELDAVSNANAEKWRKIYCNKIGAEYMHMPYPERTDWVSQRLENQNSSLEKKFILNRIMQAELLEKFIHTRYVGNKRFSLDGLAMMIPLMDSILIRAAEQGFKLVFIGMSHRGRLNTMVHTVGCPTEKIFADFEDVDPRSVLGSGDVKYHKGATGIYRTPSGKELNIHLASNPSHLEAINPVLLGRTLAKQIRTRDYDHKEIMAIILHGDAAFAGQGITAETLNAMSLRGYNVGGTINIVVNNLIGFTAPPDSLYSTRYCTNVAKRVPVPIFHVNGEAPDDVISVGEIAMDYKAKFRTDVVIDLIGYRRYGHSEIDDPTITLPTLYDKIKVRPLLYQLYAKKAEVSDEELKTLETDYLGKLDESLEKGRTLEKNPTLATMPDYWHEYSGGSYSANYEVETKINVETVEHIAQTISSVPEGFNLHRKLKRGFEDRLKMGKGEKPIDWGMAEQLAFGSLLMEGRHIRLSGQDSRRGTFNHRQSVSFDIQTGKEYIPLRNLAAEQGHFDIYDSMLSEAAILGFEYGYSREYPDGLVMWEAQFGDFVNGAQIIIDQFVSAAEDKWNLLSGIVMLLPHGYEGQGPEHSSGRLERFLQLAAEDNMQIVYPSTAAQYFHLLRRQTLRKWRKPLIVFTPKSMLRSPLAASSREKFTDSKFQRVKDDTAGFENATKLLVCSGKIVHELRKERSAQGINNVAVISIEELYPFPEAELGEIINKYTKATSVVWVQEEPANMGALFFVKPRLDKIAGIARVSTVRRAESASPATGSPKAHALEQAAILKLALSQ